VAVAASNFQLKGVVVAKRASESVAIVSYNGQPGQAVAIEAELAPGVVLKEVHDQFVIVSENGLNKRVDLPQNAGALQVDVVPPSMPPNMPPPMAAPAAPPSAPMPPPGATKPLPPPTLNPIPAASLPSAMPEPSK
jgi:general secretion pathway protein C